MDKEKLKNLMLLKQGGPTAVLLSEFLKKIDSTITTLKGEKGDKGDPGRTPIKGVDYFDGKDGRTPMHTGKMPPLNPQKGDLWYQD